MGKVARDLSFEVVSLDRDMDADIKTDIMDCDYTQYEPKHFDVIWASPPRTEYIRARTTNPHSAQKSTTNQHDKKSNQQPINMTMATNDSKDDDDNGNDNDKDNNHQ